jgi:hypothetical protein
MRFTCWLTKAAGTHSEYAIRITFPWPQWLRERASVLRYTFVACFVAILGLLTESGKKNVSRRVYEILKISPPLFTDLLSLLIPF